MRLVKVNSSGVHIPEVEVVELRSGTQLKCVSLGEKGRGSDYTIIPIPQWLKQEGIENTRFSIGTTKSGKVRLSLSKENNTNDCIVLLKPKYGSRGGVKFDLGEIEPLASGYISQGEAGRMGGNYHHLLTLKDGQSISYRRTGRLYGAESDFTVYNRRGKVACVPTWEYELEQEL